LSRDFLTGTAPLFNTAANSGKDGAIFILLFVFYMRQLKQQFIFKPQELTCFSAVRLMAKFDLQWRKMATVGIVWF